MNILIVEDEPLSLEDLLGMLQSFAGQHQLTSCASAVEALAWVEANVPDLVITDIRMPEIDGLELIRRLKARFPQLAAIVLSGYSDFEYARTGLRLGIADYLVKPVRTDALHQAVARALGALAAERTHAARVREAELARLLLGGQRATLPEPHLLAGEWGVVVLLCGNWNGPTIWRDTPIDRAFIAHALAAEAPGGCDVVDIDARCRVVLVPLGAPRAPRLDAIAQHLHHAILDAGVLVHTTYISKAAGERPERVVPAALECLAHTMRFAGPTFARPGVPAHPVADSTARDLAQLIARDLADARPADAIARLHATLKELQRSGATQASLIQTLESAFGAFQTLDSTAGGPAGREQIVTAVRACQTYAELSAWVDGQLRPILLDHRGAATPRQLVRALVAQVRTAYADDISLQSFAAEHNVSLAYFSRLFKDEIGITFSDYLTRVRIDKAKELLRQDLRLSEISALVGYDDPKYFSQIFRKVAGVSALDYQRGRPTADDRRPTDDR